MKLTNIQLQEKLAQLRIISEYEERDKEHFGLKTISPLLWRDVYSLNRIGKEEYKLLEQKHKPQAPWLSHYMAPADRNTDNGLIHIQIKLENDTDIIMKEIKKYIESAKEHHSKGYFRGIKKKDYQKIRDSKLIAICDLLLWCKIENYPNPTWILINSIIFENKLTESPIKQRYMPQAKRLLKPLHVHSLKSRLNV